MKMVTRHTKMAPAEIQRELQRLWVPCTVMNPETGEAALTNYAGSITPVRAFPDAAKHRVNINVEVPLDWIAGKDAWAYPVFFTDVARYGYTRWGIRYTPMVKDMSIVAVPITIENNVMADGTGIVNPPKSEWLTLGGSGWAAAEPSFQRDNFTQLVTVSMQLYRDGNSVLDVHIGTCYLLGLAIVYPAFI